MGRRQVALDTAGVGIIDTAIGTAVPIQASTGPSPTPLLALLCYHRGLGMG